MSCVAVLSSGTVAVVGYLHVRDLTNKAALERLASATQLQAARVLDVFDAMEADGELLSGTPPINGIIHSNGQAVNFDPIDVSTEEQWRARLATIFRSLMQRRPHYSQVRFIGIADNGRELVRVDLNGDSHLTAERQFLQQKGGEPYMIATQNLDQGEVYYSPVSRNREHGVASGPPTIRLVHPVFDGQGRLFGAVVINADYEALMRLANPVLSKDQTLTVVNANGDYVEFAAVADETRVTLHYHKDADWRTSTVLRQLGSPSASEKTSLTKELALYGLARPIGADHGNGSLAFISSVSRATLMVQSHSTLLDMALTSLGFVIAAVLTAAAFGRRQTEPLERLKIAMADLHAAKSELERSNVELNSFAYVASHDLKAPLRTIENATRWLEEDLDEHLDEDTRESMALVRSRIERMERMLDDVLQHSRICRATEDTAVISGDDLIADVIDLAAVPEGFTVKVDPAFAAIEVPRAVRCVLLNLVSNAVKHHDRDVGTIGITVADSGERFNFAVSDDGPGIPPEYHERVFGMFRTLKPRDQIEGSGMGLAMVKKRVEVAGGSLALESNGRGSTFRFSWPRQSHSRKKIGKAA